VWKDRPSHHAQGKCFITEEVTVGFVRKMLALPLAALCLVGGQSVAASRQLETAVLAGGCFWGTEAVFEHVRGVEKVVSGYAGGTSARFGQLGGERDGAAEAVLIAFDPAQISYEDLLAIYVTVAHDPTQVDRQGPDVGPRYRSAIFPRNAQQRQIAKQFLAQLRASKRFSRPIATRIESGGFTVAEPAHQDYVRTHPKSGYVVAYDLPKLEHLKQAYPQRWKS
jgi:peptide-methionine (S)-S-oxide reductase